MEQERAVSALPTSPVLWVLTCCSWNSLMVHSSSDCSARRWMVMCPWVTGMELAGQ